MNNFTYIIIYKYRNRVDILLDFKIYLTFHHFLARLLLSPWSNLPLFFTCIITITFLLATFELISFITIGLDQYLFPFQEYFFLNISCLKFSCFDICHLYIFIVSLCLYFTFLVSFPLITPSRRKISVCSSMLINFTELYFYP